MDRIFKKLYKGLIQTFNFNILLWDQTKKVGFIRA